MYLYCGVGHPHGLWMKRTYWDGKVVMVMNILVKVLMSSLKKGVYRVIN